MNIFDLVKELNGEFVSNAAQARVNGVATTLAKLDGDVWVFTPEGQKLLDGARTVEGEFTVEEATVPVKNKGGRPRKVIE